MATPALHGCVEQGVSIPLMLPVGALSLSLHPGHILASCLPEVSLKLPSPCR